MKATFVWGSFLLLITILLILDMLVFHRKNRPIGMKEASLWSGFWVVLSLLFNLFIYLFQGSEAALQFFTGYLVEKSLSIDNLFFFLLIFQFFKVPATYQHKVLYLGIWGALIMRLTLILAGTALLEHFHWVIYIFGAVLAFSGFMLCVKKEKVLDLEEHFAVRLCRCFFSLTHTYHGTQFFVWQRSRWIATPLFLVLLVIESSDLVFALDSIPAIFGFTTDPFLIYSSNAFAILGLRSLYFVLAHYMNRLRYLKVGLGLILLFVGSKMLLAIVYSIPLIASLAVIVAILVGTFLFSRLKMRR